MWVDGLTVTFEKFTTTWKKSDHTTIVALFRGHIVGIVMVEYIGGDRLQAVHMLPGYTHSIVNLSDTENLVTLMWANERFDPEHPDTFFEKV